MKDFKMFQEIQRHHEEMHRLFTERLQLPVLVWNNFPQVKTSSIGNGKQF